jgi:hypothetical protein
MMVPPLLPSFDDHAAHKVHPPKVWPPLAPTAGTLKRDARFFERPVSGPYRAVRHHYPDRDRIDDRRRDINGADALEQRKPTEAAHENMAA